MFLFSDDYLKARMKAKMAEDTSELNTDDDNSNNQKRKRIQKVLSSSDDSMDESLLEPPPKIKIYKQKVRKNGK